MPMTTQPTQAALYGDNDHWNHVLNFLFIPAIKKAGLEPIPPETRGGDVIHRNIMKNLGDTDMVLADMSGLNANVFFELGIRTALNKPVAAVVDKQSLPVPFDTGVGQYHTYDAELNAWSNDHEIERLAKHLSEVENLSRGKNPMWATFGFDRAADLPEKTINGPDALSIVLSHIQRISDQIEDDRRVVDSPMPTVRAFSSPRPAVRVGQQIIVAAPDNQKGRLTIEVQRDTYVATGSGKLEPQMNSVPHIAVRLVSSPEDAKSNNFSVRPGTGTTYDFNITMKSMVYGNYLQKGIYIFEYSAESDGTGEQDKGVTKPIDTVPGT